MSSLKTTQRETDSNQIWQESELLQKPKKNANDAGGTNRTDRQQICYKK